MYTWWLEPETRTMVVDDVHFVQPVGFVWFTKPRYRIKAGRRPH